MKIITTISICIAFVIGSSAQVAPVPYSSIESKPEKFTAATMVARMIDGLGYRYYWSTESLTDDDMIFRPSEDAASVIETVEHVMNLSKTILNAIEGKPNIRGTKSETLSFKEMREKALHNLYQSSKILTENPDLDMSQLQLTFKRGETESSFDFFHVLNGPLADAIYHTGQIVSFRRTNENPINPKVNVFMGKNRE